MGGKAKAGAHKTSSGTSKKNHLRQHLRRIIKKCLKNSKCFMDIPAFENWKRLGYGGIDELGKFSKTVEVRDDGSINILEFFSNNEIESVLSRVHVKGPAHTQKLKSKENQTRPPKKRSKGKGNQEMVAVVIETPKKKKIKKN